MHWYVITNYILLLQKSVCYCTKVSICPLWPLPSTPFCVCFTVFYILNRQVDLQRSPGLIFSSFIVGVFYCVCAERLERKVIHINSKTYSWISNELSGPCFKLSSACMKLHILSVSTWVSSGLWFSPNALLL